ncbi:LPD29 domain-containing protein [Neobacillus pocheonensis]|uniref:LPD29 domain-containing protein n=1 Tax=Neobacillus pocheonensis TaxID=363869 RepID=UPI003D265204
MTTEKISIAGKEAKKHIAEALKAVFPAVKFSYKSEYDSVNVSWTDGPLKLDVEKVLNRFVSYTLIRARDDRHEVTGYEWKGFTYIGPRHLSASRQMTKERVTALAAYMAENGKNYYDGKVFENAEAERQMIREGLLVGVEPQNRPDLMLDQSPEKDIRELEKAEAAAKAAAKQAAAAAPKPLAKVYPFPNRNKGKDMEAQRFYESLSPEQKLKLNALKFLFKVEVRDILESGVSVDEAFSMAASVINE